MLSWIQKNALQVLLRNQTASVKEMRPDGVEANLFSYHLDGLHSDGYVEKVGRGRYSLTAKGLRLVGSFSTKTNAQSEYIKTVILLYAKTPDGKYLLFKWSRQPYIDTISLVQDHMPLGKTLEQGIHDAMMDKLGTLTELRYKTTVLVRIMHDGELVTHMNGLVYEVDLRTITLPFVSRNGTAFVAWPQDEETVMDGLLDLIESIETVRQPREFTLQY